jgi:hypothetical protein
MEVATPDAGRNALSATTTQQYDAGHGVAGRFLLHTYDMIC